MWIASVVNIDWPSVPGLTAAAQKAELVALYDLAVARGMNTVVLQVRPTADAFWPSPYEPWSMYLTGTQGQDPGYDPPDFAVHAARTQPVVARMVQPLPRQYGHRRRRAAPDASGAGTPGLGHPLRREALLRPGCPGHPRILRDPYATYGAGFADKASWRRHNVDTLIRELVVGIRRVGSRVQFGVSPFAVWRNIATDPRGSDTQAGAQTYDDLFADTRRWVREEWIDYIAPQVYWAIGLPVADHAKVVDWWARQLRESGSRVRLYIGEATYKAGASTQSPAWDNDPSELSNHLARPGVPGGGRASQPPGPGRGPSAGPTPRSIPRGAAPSRCGPSTPSGTRAHRSAPVGEPLSSELTAGQLLGSSVGIGVVAL